MKTLSLLLILACQVTAFCQVAELKVSGGRAQFQAIIEVEGKTATELYALVTRWVATTYKNPEAATFSKLENEMVRGEGFQSNGVSLGILTNAHMKYAWQVDIKDGKVRFTMDDMLVMTGSAGNNPFEAYVIKKDGTERTNGQAQSCKRSFENHANNLVSSLVSALRNEKPADSDW